MVLSRHDELSHFVGHITEEKIKRGLVMLVDDGTYVSKMKLREVIRMNNWGFYIWKMGDLRQDYN